MKEIKLTRGKVAIVDDEDFARVSQFKWRTQFGEYTCYAYRTFDVRTKSKLVKKRICLHRFILEINDKSIQVDHIDKNGLNCSRKNMRLATNSQNNGNKRIRKDNTSGYRGVSYYKPSGKFKVQLAHKTIGYFKTAKEASLAYDSAAKLLYGDFYSPLRSEGRE